MTQHGERVTQYLQQPRRQKTVTAFVPKMTLTSQRKKALSSSEKHVPSLSQYNVEAVRITYLLRILIFVSQAFEIEIFCDDCKLVASLGFYPRVLGLVFVYIESSPLSVLRIHNHNFIFAFLHTTQFAIITFQQNTLPNL